MKIMNSTTAPLPLENPANKPGDTQGAKGFGEMLERAISSVNGKILHGEELSRKMAMGEPVDVADTMIALTEADISFRLLMQVRNRAISAYEEIMRLQF